MSAQKTGRNAPCPCGSGKKYKKCCLNKDSGWVPPEVREARRLELARQHEERMERARRSVEPKQRPRLSLAMLAAALAGPMGPER